MEYFSKWSFSKRIQVSALFSSPRLRSGVPSAWIGTYWEKKSLSIFFCEISSFAIMSSGKLELKPAPFYSNLRRAVF